MAAPCAGRAAARVRSTALTALGMRVVWWTARTARHRPDPSSRYAKFKAFFSCRTGVIGHAACVRLTFSTVNRDQKFAALCRRVLPSTALVWLRKTPPPEDRDGTKSAQGWAREGGANKIRQRGYPRMHAVDRASSVPTLICISTVTLCPLP